MISLSPPEPTDWFTSGFWRLRRSKFLAGSQYALDRIRPHDGGVLPGETSTLGERLGVSGLPVPVYTGKDPSGPLAPHRVLAMKALTGVEVKDLDPSWPDPAAARAALHKLFPGILSPPRFADPADPKTLVRLATEGIAAHRLRRNGSSGFVIDLTWLRRFPVRHGLVPYGARLLLSEDLASVAVEIDGCAHRPGDPGFAAARARFEASLLAAVTAMDHLLVVHLLCAGGLILALRAGTPPGHPLRAALAPFTFNSARMNSAALDVLAREGAYLHRLFGFTWPGLSALFAEGLATLDLRPVPERLARAGLADRLSDLPFWEEALGWWRPLARYAHRLTDELVEPSVAASMLASLEKVTGRLESAHDSPKAALAERLSILLFEVTVGHRQVGNAAPYVQDPAWMPVKLRPGDPERDRCRKQDLVQKTVLSFLSSRQRAPRFADPIAPRLATAAARTAWLSLDRDLGAWEEGLSARNARRRHPYEEITRAKVSTSAAV
ncbi:MAG: hypothetical protein R3B70_03585 [Polyangiaceae bacterium]